ncbi:MAG: hypothetical protein ACRD22_16950, partial [Terriglobia bacterium]
MPRFPDKDCNDRVSIGESMRSVTATTQHRAASQPPRLEVPHSLIRGFLSSTPDFLGVSQVVLTHDLLDPRRAVPMA